MKSCDLLVIEDDSSIAGLIQKTLEPLQLKILCESDGALGELRAREYLPSIILLDLGLPNLPGLEVLRRIKPWFKGAIIVITAWGDEDKKIEAFELGADDYVSKPFSPRELLARVKVALRHSKGVLAEQEVLTVGQLKIDLKEHRIWVGKDLLALTETEFRFLSILTQESGKLVSQKRLLSEIWGPNHLEDTHYLRILVSRLRKKLGRNSSVTVLTELGLGYRLLS